VFPPGNWLATQARNTPFYTSTRKLETRPLFDIYEADQGRIKEARV